MEVTGRLEGWWKDERHPIIWGYIYDDIHGRFRNGSYIHTSQIVEQTPTHVKTLNSYYKLGRPHGEGE